MYGRRRRRQGNGIKAPMDRHDVARQIAEVMSRQRRGREAAEIAKRSGRIDRRSLARVKAGYDRPFKTRSGSSPTRLKVVLVLDLSGSMMGRAVNDAVQTAWDFALASTYTPSMTLEVWGHGTAYLEEGDTSKATEMNGRGDTGVREGNVVMAYHLWKEGMSRADFARQLRPIRMAGNEDGWALDAIVSDVYARADSNERVLVLMVSDGAPVYSEGRAAFGHVRGIVNKWARKGVQTVSVSVSYALRADAQNTMYGQNVVQFNQDPRQTVAAMGRIIGKALA